MEKNMKMEEILVKFTKMHGCGNDYIYVNCFTEKIEEPSVIAKKVSDRHFGIGSDGLILICPSETADFKMRMFNADGSEGKMCGNGIRCVAKYVYDNGMTDKEVITVETLSGIKTLQLAVSEGRVQAVTVDMGSPVLTPSQIPVKCEGDRMINQPVSVGGKEYYITCVSMGNPHAVVFTEEEVTALNLEKIGPLFENHEIFPDRVNTEFIHVIDEKQSAFYPDCRHRQEAGRTIRSMGRKKHVWPQIYGNVPHNFHH